MTALNFYEAHNRNVLTHRQSLNWFRKCYDKNLNLVFLAFLYRRGFQQLFKTHPEDTVHHSRIWFLFLAILYLGFLLKLIIWWHSLFYLEITGNNANHNWKIHLTNSVEQMNHETIGRWIFNLLLKHETRLVSKPAAFFFFFSRAENVKCVLSGYQWATGGGGNRLGLIQSHLKSCLKFIKAVQFNSTNIYSTALRKAVCVLRAVWATVMPRPQHSPSKPRRLPSPTASSHNLFLVGFSDTKKLTSIDKSLASSFTHFLHCWLTLWE